MMINPNSHTPLTEVLGKLQAAGAEAFESAKPIPAEVNHSMAFLAHEQKNVFMREWICVGREDEIPDHGGYLTHEIAEVPVLVVRQKDKQLRAFVNACAHRFACLMPEEKGSAKRFSCRYHGWTYDTSGQLIGAPYMDMKPEFNKSDHKLRPLQCEVWEGFIYLSLSKNPATQLSEVLGPLRNDVVGRYNMDCYKTVLREKMVWNANWKNLIENFTESYHVPVAHAKTFAQHNKPPEVYVCGEDSDFYGYHRAAQVEESGPGAAHPDNKHLEGEWRRMMTDFCVFPCHLVTLMPDYLWYVTVQPQGIDKLQATWGVAVPPEILNDVADSDYQQWLSEIKNYIDVANGEDRELVEALHKGTRSPALPTGTYHSIERNLWQFTRYLARVCRKK